MLTAAQMGAKGQKLMRERLGEKEYRRIKKLASKKGLKARYAKKHGIKNIER
jgi:hypothetical protein